MGKLSVVVVISFAAIVGIVAGALNKRTSEAQLNTSSFYEKTQARNIARSAAEIYARELRKNPNLAGDFQLNLMGGTATVSIREAVQGNRSRLKLCSEGRYGSATRSVSVEAVDNEIVFPVISGAIGLSFYSRAKVKLDRNACIDGRNYDPNGNLSSRFPDIAGISLGHPTQASYLEYKPKDVRIRGKGLVEPNIEVQVPQPDYYDWAMRLARNAHVRYAGQTFNNKVVFGTRTNPQVTFIDGKTTFNGEVAGNGILIINGRAKFKKTIDWFGVIFCVGDSLTSEKGSFGGKGSRILGAVMIAGKKTDVKIGDVDILYCRQAVNEAIGLVPGRMSHRYSLLNWRG